MSLGNNSRKQNQKKKKFKIEEIPENARKKILIAVLITLMLIIISAWLISLRTAFIHKVEKPKDNKWESVQKDLTDFLEKTKEEFTEIKNQLNQLPRAELNDESLSETTTATTTTELSEEELERLKKKLQERKM